MKRNKKLVTTILLISSVAAIVMACLLTFIGINKTKKAYYDTFSEQLHTSGLLISNTVDNMVAGDWGVTADGKLYKGQSMVHDVYQERLDELSKKTDMQFSIFYGNIRYVTSLKDSKTGKHL